MPLMRTTDDDTHDETYDWRREGPCRHISAAGRGGLYTAKVDLSEVLQLYPQRYNRST